LSIQASDFKYICDFIKSEAGIVLAPGKEYLVENRLTILAKTLKIESLESLIVKLRQGNANDLRQNVVDALTTNETSFFRDKHPFESLKSSILPELIKKRSAIKQLNIWCAASSSGQEPYTLAMVLNQVPALNDWKVNFIASDISEEMLERCRQGIYTQLEVGRGLPPNLLPKYFSRHQNRWQIKQELKNMIDFRIFNLCKQWPFMVNMDVIFLRHVLVYFNDPTKKEILRKVRQLLKPDGYLFVGSGDNPEQLDSKFTRTEFSTSACYKVISP
jgi:chemotaxis protein methyltransferase CheR